eukprot:6849678-Prorocentrum_lima.AAC.1
MAKQRCFWSMPSIYKALALNTYSGQSSTWVYRLLEKFDKLCMEVVGSTQIVFSSFESSQRPRRRQLP